MSHQHTDKEILQKSTTKPPETKSASPQFDQGNLMDLQRTLGNQAVQRLVAEGRLQVGSGILQAKLTVGPADDQYEQEADSVAQQVMTMPDSVQREDILEEEEEELQMKRIQREEMLEEEDELQMKRIQREEMLEEDELQMKSATGAVPEVTDDIEGRIESSRGTGQALPDEARDFFEPRFDQDFSNVNIHTGGEADTLNRQLQARAFTTGSDIYFQENEYNPNSASGRELLAHELTHVVQQGGSVQKQPDDSEGV